MEALESEKHIPRPRLRRWQAVREIISTLFMMIAIFALVELATPRFYVDGRSMQPNFQDGQRLIISRVNYIFDQPHRGDIVVFNKPNHPEEESPLIKRVIGLPGETVAIRDTRLYINGIELEEPYINEPCTKFSCEDGEWVLGPDEYFVMGDNRNHSNDSRKFGPVPKENIIGEALIRYWPPPDWGIVAQIGFSGS